MTAVKRDGVLHFMNTAESGTPEFNQMDQGFNSLDESLNPETQDKQYIGQATAQTTLLRYAPQLAYAMNVESEDPVVQNVYEVHKNQVVGAERTLIHVFTFETATADGFPAIQRNYAVLPDTGAFQGEGGSEMEISGNFSQKPNSEVQGHFDVETKTFTPTVTP